jgi:hypothetical protein
VLRFVAYRGAAEDQAPGHVRLQEPVGEAEIDGTRVVEPSPLVGGEGDVEGAEVVVELVDYLSARMRTCSPSLTARRPSVRTAAPVRQPVASRSPGRGSRPSTSTAVSSPSR